MNRIEITSKNATFEAKVSQFATILYGKKTILYRLYYTTSEVLKEIEINIDLQVVKSKKIQVL